MNKFSGVWGVFSNQEQLEIASTDLSKKGYLRQSTLSPFPLPLKNIEKEKQAHVINILAMIGALFGLLSALFFITNISIEWIQPLSAKPLLSFIPLLPVLFEITVLVTVVFLILGTALIVVFNRKRSLLPTCSAFKQFTRFTRDRFGLVIVCDKDDVQKVKSVFQKNEAEEVYVEV